MIRDIVFISIASTKGSELLQEPIISIMLGHIPLVYYANRSPLLILASLNAGITRLFGTECIALNQCREIYRQ